MSRYPDCRPGVAPLLCQRGTRSVNAAAWPRGGGGPYSVRLDGEWIDVPDEAVITEPNRIGRTMVWPLRGYLGLTIRCFMPGSMT